MTDDINYDVDSDDDFSVPLVDPKYLDVFAAIGRLIDSVNWQGDLSVDSTINLLLDHSNCGKHINIDPLHLASVIATMRDAGLVTD